MMRGEDRFLAISGILTAAASVLAAFFFFGPVPCFDDWILVPLIDKIYAGKIAWADFWAMHTEHRLLFPKFILSYAAAATRWDLRFIPFADLLLVVWATACLSSLAAGSEALRFWKRPAFWAALTFTLSLRATKAALWPIMLSAYLCSACVVVAYTWIGERSNWLRWWLAAAGLTIVASYSFAGGMMAWFAAIPLLFFIRHERGSRSAPVLWFVAAVWTFFFYFRNFTTPAGHPSLLLAFKQPVEYGVFFFRYVGSVFEPMPGALFGIAGTFLALKLTWSAFKSRSGAQAALASVALWVLANAAVTAAARLHFGPLAATTDRYLPVSSFLWAALAVWMTPLKTVAARRALIFAIGCVLVLTPGHAWVAYRYRESHKWAETVLRKQSWRKDELQAIFYDPDALPGYISILKKRGLSVFRKDYERAAGEAVRREDASA